MSGKGSRRRPMLIPAKDFGENWAKIFKNGILAKEFVEETLHVGGTYRLQTKEKGKFGRYLGTIYLTDDTSINAALVTEHLAVPYHGQSKEEIESAHKANYKILSDKWLI